MLEDHRLIVNFLFPSSFEGFFVVEVYVNMNALTLFLSLNISQFKFFIKQSSFVSLTNTDRV